MSWVFLTEQYAYKLKKPLRTSRLDHTTIEDRRRACHTELELNRRLAPSVYLDVVPVVEHDERLQVEGIGPTVDWMVKMRRLPRDHMLDNCIERGEVERSEIDRVAVRLAEFYATSDEIPTEGTEYRNRIASDIASKRASLKQPRYGLEEADIQAVVEAQKRWLEMHGETLEARNARVVDAHGDLRPEHICLEDEPRIIDCLEFDRSLRLLDPVSELSFLSLECERLGAPWIGEQLFDVYAERTGDRPAPPLLPFYKSHHALIRAAIAIWHLDDETLDSAEKWRGKANRYLTMAQKKLRRA